MDAIKAIFAIYSRTDGSAPTIAVAPNKEGWKSFALRPSVIARSQALYIMIAPVRMILF